MRNIKLIALGLGILLVPLLAFSGIAGAQSFKTGETITVAADQTIDSMLFAGGNKINIAGTVNGDVYCAGQTITISGTIKGDVFCAGQTITVKGIIEGDARLAAQDLDIDSSIVGSATIATQSFDLGKDGSIGRDLLGGAQAITIDGNISRDVLAGSQSLTINGVINRDIKGEIEEITVGSAGYVGGSLDYTGLNDPKISDGGKIIGSVKRTEPKTDKSESSVTTPFSFSIGWFIFVLVAMLVFSIALVLLFPRTYKEGTLMAVKKPWQMLLIGFVAAIVMPVLIFILFISTIGIPLAIITLLIWIVILILSGSFVSYLIGDLILQKSKNNKPILNMLVGGIIITIAFFIPFIGFLLFLAVHAFGAGIILMECKKLVGNPTTKKSS